MCKRQNQSLGIKFPYNFDFDLISGLAEINAEADTLYPIEELYCSDPWSLLGSGRPGVALNQRVRDYGSYVAEAHRHGLRFNYLVNAAYLDGREQSPAILQELRRQIGQLVDVGLDAVTVANPFLARNLQSWFPTLKLVASVNLHLDSVERVRQLLADVSFHCILLDHRFSRNFELMKAVRGAFPDLQIAVLVNESCLPDCVYQPYHQNLLAAMSRCERAGEPLVDCYHPRCARQKLLHAELTLKAPWLRPEDLVHLAAAGVNTVKLAGRTKDAEWALRLARAYTKGHYDGDIFQFVEKSGLTSPDWERTLGRKLPPARYRVDNRALDGFITPFVAGSVPCVAGHEGCGDCQWCSRFCAKAVVPPENLDERLRDLAELDTMLGCVPLQTKKQPTVDAA